MRVMLFFLLAACGSTDAVPSESEFLKDETAPLASKTLRHPSEEATAYRAAVDAVPRNTWREVGDFAEPRDWNDISTKDMGNHVEEAATVDGCIHVRTFNWRTGIDVFQADRHRYALCTQTN